MPTNIQIIAICNQIKECSPPSVLDLADKRQGDPIQPFLRAACPDLGKRPSWIITFVYITTLSSHGAPFPEKKDEQKLKRQLTAHFYVLSANKMCRQGKTAFFKSDVCSLFKNQADIL